MGRECDDPSPGRSDISKSLLRTGRRVRPAVSGYGINGSDRGILDGHAIPCAQALWQAARLEAMGVPTATTCQLADSLAAAAAALPGLLRDAAAAGWNLDDMPIRVGPCRFMLEGRSLSPRASELQE